MRTLTLRSQSSLRPPRQQTSINIRKPKPTWEDAASIPPSKGHIYTSRLFGTLLTACIAPIPKSDMHKTQRRIQPPSQSLIHIPENLPKTPKENYKGLARVGLSSLSLLGISDLSTGDVESPSPDVAFEAFPLPQPFTKTCR